RRRLLRRQRRRADLLERDGRGPPPARRADRCADRQRRAAAAGKRDRGGIVTPAQADALVATLPPLAGITADSRRVAQRMAFAAYPGTAHDGRTFIDDALARGASAIVYEARDFAWPARADVAHAAVSNLKTSVGPIASAIYDHPSQALWMV